MAASDYVSIFFKNRLHLEGRPQMSTRPNEYKAYSLVDDIIDVQVPSGAPFHQLVFQR